MIYENKSIEIQIRRKYRRSNVLIFLHYGDLSIYKGLHISFILLLNLKGS